MNPFAFQKFGRKALGIGAVALTLFTAACGYASSTASTPGGSSSSTTSASSCSVSQADLTRGPGGQATAQNYNITGSKTLSINGSTALAPLFQYGQPAFDTANGTTTSINPTGSGAGLTAVESGAAQIGMSDIFAQEKSTTAYTDLVDHQVAVVIFAMVVSPDLQGKITNLTTQQIQQIYSGTITNWSAINPSVNEPITVFIRTKGSGTRATFDRYIIGNAKTTADNPSGAQSADKTGELVTDVANAQGGIGYAATSFIGSNGASSLTALCIDGFKPTPADIEAGNYKFWNFEHAYTKGTPTAGSVTDAFLKFVTSSPFQTMDLPAKNFLSIGSIPSSVQATHQVGANG